MSATVIALDAPSYAHLGCGFGTNLVRAVVVGGRLLQRTAGEIFMHATLAKVFPSARTPMGLTCWESRSLRFARVLAGIATLCRRLRLAAAVAEAWDPAGWFTMSLCHYATMPACAPR